MRTCGDYGILVEVVTNAVASTIEIGKNVAATTRWERRYRTLVSTFLVLALGAQIATLGVTLVRPGWLAATVYPILEYTMYAQAHYDGERVTGRWLLRGQLANGGVIDITEQTLRVSIWDFGELTEQVAVGKPGTPETLRGVQRLISVVREREPRANEIRMLRIDSYPMKVTQHGAQTTPSQTVATIAMPTISGNEQ